MVLTTISIKPTTAPVVSTYVMIPDFTILGGDFYSSPILATDCEKEATCWAYSSSGFIKNGVGAGTVGKGDNLYIPITSPQSKFLLVSGYDTYGYDIAGYNSPSPTACLNDCLANPACVVAVFRSLDFYNCYNKYQFNIPFVSAPSYVCDMYLPSFYG